MALIARLLKCRFGLKLGFGVCSILVCLQASAAGVIVVNAENTVELSDRHLRSLFMGKRVLFPDKSQATVYIPASGDAGREQLLIQVIKRDDAQLEAYWSQLTFSGRGHVPTILEGSSVAIRDRIANNKQAIGIIDSSLLTDKLRVVRELDG